MLMHEAIQVLYQPFSVVYRNYPERELDHRWNIYTGPHLFVLQSSKLGMIEARRTLKLARNHAKFILMDNRSAPPPREIIKSQKFLFWPPWYRRSQARVGVGDLRVSQALGSVAVLVLANLL
jgi:hypothetical protein